MYDTIRYEGIEAEFASMEFSLFFCLSFSSQGFSDEINWIDARFAWQGMAWNTIANNTLLKF